MAVNYNILLDALGILVVFVTKIVHIYYACIAYIVTERMVINKYYKMRKNKINCEIKTLALNILATVYFLIVLSEWAFMKIDTAPTVIDVQVFILECILCAVLLRSSKRSLGNIVAATKHRKCDNEVKAGKE